LEEGFEDAVQILFLPLPLRKRLRTSNSIERLNQEIRRREQVIRIFPNRESLKHLMDALLMADREMLLTS
jgi:transposase-like protein